MARCVREGEEMSVEKLVENLVNAAFYWGRSGGTMQKLDSVDVARAALLSHVAGLRDELERQKLGVAVMLTSIGQQEYVTQLRAENERLKLRILDADALADAVTLMIQRNALDSRSLAGDALLDYRDPPQGARLDAIQQLEQRNAELRAAALSVLEAWGRGDERSIIHGLLESAIEKLRRNVQG